MSAAPGTGDVPLRTLSTARVAERGEPAPLPAPGEIVRFGNAARDVISVREADLDTGMVYGTRLDGTAAGVAATLCTPASATEAAAFGVLVRALDRGPMPPDQNRRTTRCCASCRFWAAEHDGEGQCRINPPQPVLRRDAFDTIGHTFGWPVTYAHDWCGLWQHDRRGPQPDEPEHRRTSFADAEPRTRSGGRSPTRSPAPPIQGSAEQVADGLAAEA